MAISHKDYHDYPNAHVYGRIDNEQVERRITDGVSGQSTPYDDTKFVLDNISLSEFKVLLEMCDTATTECLLVEAAQNGNDMHRSIAAVHKHTPISSVVMLQSDTNRRVRQLAAIRLSTYEETKNGAD